MKRLFSIPRVYGRSEVLLLCGQRNLFCRTRGLDRIKTFMSSLKILDPRSGGPTQLAGTALMENKGSSSQVERMPTPISKRPTLMKPKEISDEEGSSSVIKLLDELRELRKRSAEMQKSKLEGEGNDHLPRNYNAEPIQQDPGAVHPLVPELEVVRSMLVPNSILDSWILRSDTVENIRLSASENYVSANLHTKLEVDGLIELQSELMIALKNSAAHPYPVKLEHKAEAKHVILQESAFLLWIVQLGLLMKDLLVTTRLSCDKLVSCMKDVEESLLILLPTLWEKHAHHLPLCSSSTAEFVRHNLLKTAFTSATPDATIFCILTPIVVVGSLRLIGNDLIDNEPRTKPFQDVITSYVVYGCDPAQRKGLWKTLLLLDGYRSLDKAQSENGGSASLTSSVQRTTLDESLTRGFGWYWMNEDGKTVSCRSVNPVPTHPLHATVALLRHPLTTNSTTLRSILISGVAAMWTVARLPPSLFSMGASSYVLKGINLLSEALIAIRDIQTGLGALSPDTTDLMKSRNEKQLITAFCALSRRYQDFCRNVSPDLTELHLCSRSFVECFNRLFNDESSIAVIQHLTSKPNDQRVVLNALQNAVQLGMMLKSRNESHESWLGSCIASIEVFSGVSNSPHIVEQARLSLRTMFRNLRLEQQQIVDIKMRVHFAILSLTKHLTTDLENIGQKLASLPKQLCEAKSETEATSLFNKTEGPDWSLVIKFIEQSDRQLLASEDREDMRIWAESRQDLVKGIVQYTGLYRRRTMVGSLKMKAFDGFFDLPPPSSKDLHAMMTITQLLIDWDRFSLLPESSREQVLQLVAFCEELFLVIKERVFRGMSGDLLSYLRSADLKPVPGLQSLSRPLQLFRASKVDDTSLRSVLNDARRIIRSALDIDSTERDLEQVPAVSNLLTKLFSADKIDTETHPISVLLELTSTDIWMTEPPELLADLILEVSEQLWESMDDDAKQGSEKVSSTSVVLQQTLALGCFANSVLQFNQESSAFDHILQINSRLTQASVTKPTAFQPNSMIMPWLPSFAYVVMHRLQGNLRQKTIEGLSKICGPIFDAQLLTRIMGDLKNECLADLASFFRKCCRGSFTDEVLASTWMGDMVGLRSGSDLPVGWRHLFTLRTTGLSGPFDSSAQLNLDTEFASSPEGRRVMKSFSYLGLIRLQLINASRNPSLDNSEPSESSYLPRLFALCLAEIFDAMDAVDVVSFLPPGDLQRMQVLADSAPVYFTKLLYGTSDLITSFVREVISHTLDEMHDASSPLLGTLLLELCATLPAVTQRIPFIFDSTVNQRWLIKATDSLVNPLEKRTLTSCIDEGRLLLAAYSGGSYHVLAQNNTDYRSRFGVFLSEALSGADETAAEKPSAMNIGNISDDTTLYGVMENFGILFLEFMSGLRASERGEQLGVLWVVFQVIQVMGSLSRQIQSRAENATSQLKVPVSWKESQSLLLETLEILQGPPRFDKKVSLYTFSFEEVPPQDIVATVEALETGWSVAVLGRVLLQIEILVKQQSAKHWKPSLVSRLEASMDRCLDRCSAAEATRIGGLVEKCLNAIPK